MLHLNVFFSEHGCISDVYIVIGGSVSGHQRERVLASHQSDIDVEQEKILQEKVQV